MSQARFSALTSIRESAFRTLALIESIPYVKMTTPNADIRQPEIMTEDGKKALSVWASAIFAAKTPEHDTVESPIYVLDEILSFYNQLVSDVYLAAQRIADETAAVSGKPKKVLPPMSADELTPYFAAMVQGDRRSLELLDRNLEMLVVITEKALLKFSRQDDVAPELRVKTKYPLDRLSYAVTAIRGAVGAALLELDLPQAAKNFKRQAELEARQEMGITAQRVAELAAERAQSVAELGEERVVALEAQRQQELKAQKEAEARLNEQREAEAKAAGPKKPLTAEERAAFLAKQAADRLKDEYKNVLKVTTLLGQTPAESYADLKYSREKYQELQNAIYAMSTQERPSVSALSVNVGESKESEESINIMATPTSESGSESSSVASSRVSVESRPRGISASFLSHTDDKSLKKFAGKGKVRELNSRTAMIAQQLRDTDAERNPNRLEELKYWLTLLTYITTKNHTSEKGYNSMGGLFFKPSTLKIKIENDILDLLGRETYDKFKDFDMHNIWKTGSKDIQVTLNAKRQEQKDKWLEKVTVDLFANAISAATTTLEVNLVTYTWLNFLVDTKDIAARDAVVLQMHKLKLIDSLFEKLLKITLSKENVLFLGDALFQYIDNFQTAPDSSAEKAKIATIAGVMDKVLKGATSPQQVSMLAYFMQILMNVNDIPLRKAKETSLRDGVLKVMHDKHIIDGIFEKLSQQALAVNKIDLLAGNFFQYIDRYKTVPGTPQDVAKITTLVGVFESLVQTVDEKQHSLAAKQQSLDMRQKSLNAKQKQVEDAQQEESKQSNAEAGQEAAELKQQLIALRQEYTVLRDQVGFLTELVQSFLAIGDPILRDAVLKTMHDRHIIDGVFEEQLKQALSANKIELLGNTFFQYINTYKTKPDTDANKAKIATVITVFEDVLRNAGSRQQIGLLADLVHKFLGIKDMPFRNGVLKAMHDKHMLDVLLEQAFPAPSVRESMKSQFKIPDFPHPGLESPRFGR
jgi:hypothetical protein